MKNAAHTPGPWIAVGYQVEVLSDSIPDICNTNPETFGQHGRKDGERKANARLIAAAPELLEVLIDCCCCLELGGFYQELAIVHAAIRKAGGRP